MFKVEIKTGNAAFHDYDEDYDDYAKVSEVVRILKIVIEQLESGYTNRKCVDLCGNVVGEWELR